MKCASVPSEYRNCILRASVRTARNFSPARNVRSMTLPSEARRSFVRTNAPPLPGLTCWNSTTLKIVPSTSMWLPFLNWFVLIKVRSVCRGSLRGSGRGLPEGVDLRRLRALDGAREGPQLDRLVALVAVRAHRLGRDPHGRAGLHPLDRVAKAHGQRAAGDEVELLELLVVVARALLEVAVRRDPDQRDGELLGAERLRQPPELSGHVGARVAVLDVVGAGDRVVGHAAHLPRLG